MMRLLSFVGLLTVGAIASACGDATLCPQAVATEQGTVGSAVGTIERVELGVNRSDGFLSRRYSDSFSVDLRDGAIAAFLIDGQTYFATRIDRGTESCDQLHRVTDALSSAAWRSKPDCRAGNWVDGGPYAPVVRIQGKTGTKDLGVSDAACATTDHGFQGDVIGCSAFKAVFDVVREIVPEAEPVFCQDYW